MLSCLRKLLPPSHKLLRLWNPPKADYGGTFTVVLNESNTAYFTDWMAQCDGTKIAHPSIKREYGGYFGVFPISISESVVVLSYDKKKNQ